MTRAASETLPPLLSASRLNIAYGDTKILDGVDFAIRPREIVTLIGPNGSGKTTLIRALLSLVAPSAGTVTRSAGLRIGYVPQSFVRDKSLPMTALRFTRSFGGGSAVDAHHALERTGVAHVAERPLFSLSGGEMARVALARAILRKPQLLVLDEPLSGVDLAGEAALYELIAAMRDELGAAILLVSHDLHVVMAAADHVVCLNRHVCCEGDAKRVARDPAFIALFGPQVAEQIALYAHSHDHSHTPSGAIAAGEADHRHGPRHDPGHTHG